MHSHNIVHRDCKLENILLEGNPSRGLLGCTMRITDFNLSAMLRPIASPSRRSSEGISVVDGSDDGAPCAQQPVWDAHPALLVRPPTPTSVLDGRAALERMPPALHSHVGSAPYAATEVWAVTPTGRGYGMKVDIYAAGVCAYAALMDAFPFADRHDMSLRTQMAAGSHNVVFHQQQRLQHGRPPLSPMAQRFLTLLLTADPERRPNAEAALAHPWPRMDDAGGSPEQAGAMSPWASLPFSSSVGATSGEPNTPSPVRDAIPRRWSILTCGTTDPEASSVAATWSNSSSMEPLSRDAHAVPAPADPPAVPLAQAADAGSGGAQQDAHAHHDVMAWTAFLSAILCCGRLDD